MVFFQCDSCGEALKKAKVESHRYQCRNSSVSCIDCNKTFPGSSYSQHSTCVSEAERYQVYGQMALICLHFPHAHGRAGGGCVELSSTGNPWMQIMVWLCCCDSCSTGWLQTSQWSPLVAPTDCWFRALQPHINRASCTRACPTSRRASRSSSRDG